MTSADSELCGDALNRPSLSTRDNSLDHILSHLNRLISLAVAVPRVIVRLTSLARAIARTMGLVEVVEENNIGTARQSSGTCWAAIDAGSEDSVEK